jgi:hypothetical protein
VEENQNWEWALTCRGIDAQGQLYPANVDHPILYALNGFFDASSEQGTECLASVWDGKGSQWRCARRSGLIEKGFGLWVKRHNQSSFFYELKGLV